MKIRLILAFSIFIVSIAGWGYAQNPWLGKTLRSQEVKAKWGSENFDEARFKAGDQELRAKMAFSLMTGNKLRGLNTLEIRDRLGDFSGHYFSESYPTYLIQEAKEKGQDSWQLVFLIDRDLKVKDVIVHKNCCD